MIIKRALPFLALAGLLGAPAVRAESPRLTREEVSQVLAQGATKARQVSATSIIAVTDREGFLLGLWDARADQPATLPAFSLTDPVILKRYALVGAAITRASTAAFLSSDQNAFTSRTAGFIIQQHFPPGVRNTPTGPLVGVGFSSLFFSDVNRVKLIPPGFDGAAPAAATVSPGVRAPAFPLTSLDDSPGGVPLYKKGTLVGGVGVTGDGSPTNLLPAGAIFFSEDQSNATTGFQTARDRDEEVALGAQTHFRPPADILADQVLIAGIRIPYVKSRVEEIEDVHDPQPLGQIGHRIDVSLGPRSVASGDPQASPADYDYQTRTLRGVEGLVRFPFRADPLLGDPARGQIGRAGRLIQEEVEEIISLSAERSGQTRAGIRLPIGTNAKVFIAVVANPNRAGERPPILGVFQTGEATIFSWDVAVQKARTALFFSNQQLAFSSRTVGFLAQRFFPPGLDGRAHGPLFGFQEAVSLRRNPAGGFPGNPNLPNGMTIFPGGFPLYRDGSVIGAIGISGDGVDQDDWISAAGTIHHLPPGKIRADSYAYRGARLPYAKFPRDPQQ